MAYTKSHLDREMKQWFLAKGMKHIPLVYCEIYGTPMYLNETQIRFLQVQCKNHWDYDEFCRTHVVYSGRYKRQSDHIMHFRRDGKFVEEFEGNFYVGTAELAFEVL